MKTDHIIIIVAIAAIAGARLGCIAGKVSLSTPTAKEAVKLPYVAGVRVLESNTVTYVQLDSIQGNLYVPHDTVWINLYSHTVNDIDSNTMLAVIVNYPERRQ